MPNLSVSLTYTPEMIG